MDSTIHRIPTTLMGLPDWDMRLKEARDGHCTLRHVYSTAKCFCRKHGSDSRFLITNPSLLAWCFKRATSFTLREDLWLKFVGSGVCVCMFLTTCMCMWLHVFLYGLCAYPSVYVCVSVHVWTSDQKRTSLVFASSPQAPSPQSSTRMTAKCWTAALSFPGHS